MKSEKTLKTTIFHWVTVSKPLGQNWIMRYLWKDNIHIFNLTPSGPIYPQYFCHTEPFYKQGPTKKWENGELSVHIFSRPWFCTPFMVPAEPKQASTLNDFFSVSEFHWMKNRPYWHLNRQTAQSSKGVPCVINPRETFQLLSRSLLMHFDAFLQVRMTHWKMATWKWVCSL